MAFLAMLGLSAALVAGFLGTLHPAFDSFAHFRIHFAVLMALIALPLLATSFRLQAGVGLLLAVAAFASTLSTLPRLWPVQAANDAAPGNEPVYRLLQMNLRFNNPTPKKVLSLIARTNPDVITLDEVSSMWATELGYIASAYPHRILCDYPNGVFGVALLSRRPFAAGTVPHCEPRGAMATATVDFGGTPVDVAAIHLSWPWPKEQYWQIGELTKTLTSLGETAIMPDFLRRYAGLPIDQVFSKGGVTILSSTRLEDTGSDHLPVMVEFSLMRDETKPVDEDATATVSLIQPSARG